MFVNETTSFLFLDILGLINLMESLNNEFMNKAFDVINRNDCDAMEQFLSQGGDPNLVCYFWFGFWVFSFYSINTKLTHQMMIMGLLSIGLTFGLQSMYHLLFNQHKTRTSNDDHGVAFNWSHFWIRLYVLSLIQSTQNSHIK